MVQISSMAEENRHVKSETKGQTDMTAHLSAHEQKGIKTNLDTK